MHNTTWKTKEHQMNILRPAQPISSLVREVHVFLADADEELLPSPFHQTLTGDLSLHLVLSQSLIKTMSINVIRNCCVGFSRLWFSPNVVMCWVMWVFLPGSQDPPIPLSYWWEDPWEVWSLALSYLFRNLVHSTLSLCMINHAN